MSGRSSRVVRRCACSVRRGEWGVSGRAYDVAEGVAVPGRVLANLLQEYVEHACMVTYPKVALLPLPAELPLPLPLPKELPEILIKMLFITSYSL